MILLILALLFQIFLIIFLFSILDILKISSKKKSPKRKLESSTLSLFLNLKKMLEDKNWENVLLNRDHDSAFNNFLIRLITVSNVHSLKKM